MKKLLIATTNKGKLKELSEFLSDLPLDVVSLSDVGIIDEVEEDRETYEENARKKAIFYANKSGLPALSDDGGLEIAALNNAPGVRSKRWLGDNATENDLLMHMEKVAKELPEDNRFAAFVNVIAFALPTTRATRSSNVWTTSGRIEGIIAKTPFSHVTKGLPYRKFFFLPLLQKYYHDQDLTKEEMAMINHRKKSIEAMKEILREQLLTKDKLR